MFAGISTCLLLVSLLCNAESASPEFKQAEFSDGASTISGSGSTTSGGAFSIRSAGSGHHKLMEECSKCVNTMHNQTGCDLITECNNLAGHGLDCEAPMQHFRDHCEEKCRFELTLQLFKSCKHRLILDLEERFLKDRATTRRNKKLALYSATLAISSETPSTSNNILPGLTLQAKNSGFPLPLPIRTSIGFFEIGIFGNTLVQTLP